MATAPVNMGQYRKFKSRARVLEALAHFQAEALNHLSDHKHALDEEAFEEFMAQILGDHFTAHHETKLESAQHLRRFTDRVKKRMASKLKSNELFDTMMKH